MTFYIYIKENKLNGCGQCPIVNSEVINAEVTQEVYNEYREEPLKYICQDGEVIANPNYEEEKEQQERERLDSLTLTRGDVFAGLIQARMIDESVLAQMVEQMPETTPEEKMAKMLSKNALANALNFHRNHPMVATIGAQLGVSSENLDLFFETNDYTYLLPEEPIVEPDEEETNGDNE